MPFILIVIGLVLIIFNYKAVKRGGNSFEIQDRDDSFDKVLNNSKNEMTDYQLELGLLRKNLGESLTELQQEILEIKTRLRIIENNNIGIAEDNKLKFNMIKDYDNINEDIIPKINVLNDDSIETSIKAEKIIEFLKMGLTEEEICHELSISKGEVLLVKELFKK
ncbi:hypothetical protein [Clostridium sp. SM-530-WT-3G]|uniref:hypothetical protein n=1 Tax=Clostridium sp. SM-530-WT-3G TaxID=2725303 RepID=UPI00145C98C0|nr:hypothetical protein [Clostridium sp. SM-530-WT-3G]NME82751.1 hypothetical protein [Clostridium sp. SM-530-WT-3G]